MTQEEFEDLKGRIFRDIESIKSNCSRQALPRRSATITTESQMVGILPTTTQQASTSTQAAASSSYVYYTPSPLGFGNPPSVLTLQDEGSRHNLSGILSQLPDLTSTQIIEQPQQQQQQQQPQLFTITTTAPPQQQQPPQQPSSQGGSLTWQALFRATQIFQKQLFKLQVISIPLPKHNSSVQILIKKKKKKKKSNTYTTPNMKQITHGTTHKKGHIEKKTPNMANNQPIFSFKSMGLVKIFNKKVQHLHHPHS